MRKYELQSNRSRDNDQSRNIDVGWSFKVKASDWFSKSDGDDFTGRVLYSERLNSSFLSLYRLFVAEARRLQAGWSICWKNHRIMLVFHIVNLPSESFFPSKVERPTHRSPALDRKWLIFVFLVPQLWPVLVSICPCEVCVRPVKQTWRPTHIRLDPFVTILHLMIYDSVESSQCVWVCSSLQEAAGDLWSILI